MLVTQQTTCEVRQLSTYFQLIAGPESQPPQLNLSWPLAPI
jgi:hypothetical protein